MSLMLAVRAAWSRLRALFDHDRKKKLERQQALQRQFHQHQ
jgi:hypothetical protein